MTVWLCYGGLPRYSEYVKYFNNFIKNLRIETIETENITTVQYPIGSFVKAKCDPNLHQITIAGDMELVTLCEGIKSFIHRVEILEFLYMSLAEDDDDEPIPNAPPNLTTLALYNVRQKQNIETILGLDYQKLKHLHWQYSKPDPLNAKKLMTFLQCNDQIQCIDLSYDNHKINDYQMDVIMGCIKTVTDFALNLQYLSCEVSQRIATDRFGQFCGYLKVLCDRDTFRSLHLKFNHPWRMTHELLALHQNQLANFKQLTKISLSGDPHLDFVRVLRPYTHLKTIVVCDLLGLDGWSNWNTLDELIDLVDTAPIIALPQIEELTINGVYGNELLTCLMQVARHWVNLKKVSATWDFSAHFDGTFPVAELNRARMRLENACELTLFVHYENYNATNLDCDLVKLKYVEFDSDCSFPQHCMLRN